MSANRYDELLREAAGAESFVRRSLAYLESDFRALALLALADWERAEIVSSELFPALGGLQRPAWGTWNGLLSALRSARREWLRSGSAAERQKVEQAAVLARALQLLDERLDAAAAESLKRLCEATRWRGGKLTAGNALSMAIGVRNLVAHDPPADEAGWGRLAGALRPLVEWQARRSFLESLGEPAEYRPPWFEREGATLWMFNGLEEDFSARYVAEGREPKYSAEGGARVIQSLQRLLGKAGAQERDFRKLLSKLAPEEVKGALMGDFLVGRPVGEGGFATVHLGRQLSTGRQVAIKILHDGTPEDIQLRFQQEAAYLSRFSHPNIVGVYAYGEETWRWPRSFSLSGEPWFEKFSRSAPVKTFIALEWIEGETLESLYQKRLKNPVALEQQMRWFLQAANALSAVHGTGLIHRDIKPGNLMVNAEGTIKLMDFGIARTQSEERTIQTTTGKTIGTPAYMSPEQIRAADAEAEVGPGTDIYSLCATFYELCTGTRLYHHDRESAETVKTQKLAGRMPDSPRKQVKGLPWEVETILLGGLEPELSDRYRTAAEVERDVRHFLADEPIEHKRPSAIRRVRLAYRRNRTVANLVACFVLLAVAGTIFYIHRIKAEQAKTEARERTIRKNSVQSDFLIAAEKVEQGRPDQALAYLGRALKLDPGHAPSQARMFTLVAQRRWNAPLWRAQFKSDVRSIQFSPDGRWVVMASNDNTATVWETATGKPVGEPMRHENAVESAQFSPDGRWVATASQDKTARVWDAATGKPVSAPMQHELLVWSAQFSPDGRWVVTASTDKTARVWEAATGKPVGEPMRHGGLVASAQFSPDGRWVATASWDKTARVWEAATGKPVGEPMGHGSYVQSAEFSPDGRWLVTASFDRTARVWEAATGKPVSEPMAHGDIVSCAHFSADGRRVVTASEDKTARVWDAATGKPIGAPMRHEDKVWWAQFSPDGRWVVTASFDKTARLWEAATGKPVGEPMRHEEGVWRAQFSPDGRWAATAAGDTARLWEAATGGPVGASLRHPDGVESAEFSPDGRWILTVSGDNAARVWDAAAGKTLGEPMRHEESVMSARFSPDGRWVVTACWDGGVRLWEAATGKPAGEPIRLGGIAEFAEFSPDGRWLVTASGDHTARLWDAATGQPLGAPMRHDSRVLSARFSPDGRRVVTAAMDNTARVWEAATGKPVGEPMRHENVVISAQFSPDGRWVATASSDGTARVWDAATGKPVSAPMRHGHGERVVSVQFSPDGRRVLTASWDATARLWDAATGKPVGEPIRHEKTVASARFSPDGRWVLTASWDRTARVWDALTGKPVSDPMRHADDLRSAEFSPDGRWVVTASDDGTAQVWPFAEYSPSADATALMAMGEYCGGLVLDPESGLLRQPSDPEPAARAARFMEMRRDPLYGNLVRWIVDPPDQRPACPLR